MRITESPARFASATYTADFQRGGRQHRRSSFDTLVIPNRTRLPSSQLSQVGSIDLQIAINLLKPQAHALPPTTFSHPTSGPAHIRQNSRKMSATDREEESLGPRTPAPIDMVEDDACIFNDNDSVRPHGTGIGNYRRSPIMKPHRTSNASSGTWCDQNSRSAYDNAQDFKSNLSHGTGLIWQTTTPPPNPAASSNARSQNFAPQRRSATTISQNLLRTSEAGAQGEEQGDILSTGPVNPTKKVRFANIFSRLSKGLKASKHSRNGLLHILLPNGSRSTLAVNTGLQNPPLSSIAIKNRHRPSSSEIFDGTGETTSRQKKPQKPQGHPQSTATPGESLYTLSHIVTGPQAQFINRPSAATLGESLYTLSHLTTGSRQAQLTNRPRAAQRSRLSLYKSIQTSPNRLLGLKEE